MCGFWDSCEASAPIRIRNETRDVVCFHLHDVANPEKVYDFLIGPEKSAIILRSDEAAYPGRARMNHQEKGTSPSV
jgi:hypothetical protein